LAGHEKPGVDGMDGVREWEKRPLGTRTKNLPADVIGSRGEGWMRGGTVEEGRRKIDSKRGGERE